MTKRVVVLGAGIGGQLAARGIKDTYPDLEVILIGEVNSTTHGLFYFNERIPGVAERRVPVTYSTVGDGAIQDYQKKSRGEVNESVKVSSFDKIGKTEIGYLTDGNISLSGIYNLPFMAEEIDLVSKTVNTCFVNVNYDILISTIPLPTFFKIGGFIDHNDMYKKSFKWKPVFEKVTSNPFQSGDITEIKVFYDTDPSSVFYRHTSYYCGDQISRMVSESITDFKGYDSVLPMGKIIPSEFISECVVASERLYNNVKFCGRYARWEYHYLVSDTYKDAINFVSSYLDKD